MAGPDHWFASNVEELSQYVMDIRSIEKCIGVSHLFPTKKEMAMRDLARRKIILLSDMKKGEILLINNIDYKRAIGDGLPPKYIGFIVDRKLKINKYDNEKRIQEKCY